MVIFGLVGPLTNRTRRAILWDAPHIDLCSEAWIEGEAGSVAASTFRPDDPRPSGRAAAEMNN
ncbi:hypothetical protein GCM10012287_47010 [Streptomyces daqingensis]|jgi:hypothetical protein|uniref:Uncharacterized protein n=1 Tax=Streptomyces daqingensis TaxID=1472640 RepID=A0ABQ2MP30_9ACTN|nr:hypothetical protein GCM10012287_47010 [Streptomyces daqingensis]